MRRIGGVAGGRGVGGARAGGSRPAGGFNLGAAAPLATAGAVAPVAPFGGGLLALQEATGAAERDAAATRRAGAMLEELDGLLLDLLSGSRDPARLQRLAGLGQGEDGADPALREAVQGLALRARVELARREMDGSATAA